MKSNRIKTTPPQNILKFPRLRACVSVYLDFNQHFDTFRILLYNYSLDGIRVSSFHFPAPFESWRKSSELLLATDDEKCTFCKNIN